MILSGGGVFRDTVDGGVAAALEYGILLRRQQRQDALGPAGLLRRADQSDGGAVQVFAGGLAVGAEPRAHQQLIHAVAHMSQTDGADGAQLVGRQGDMKIIHERVSPLCVFTCNSMPLSGAFGKNKYRQAEAGMIEYGSVI